MAKAQSNGGDEDDETAPSLPLEVLRERAKARRRREIEEEERRNVVDSRRRKVRTFAVCVGTLVLMGLALYFALTRDDSQPPADSLAQPAPVGTIISSSEGCDRVRARRPALLTGGR